MRPLLEVKNLSVSFRTEDGVVKATDDVSYSLSVGETLAIVGESGSGKSVSSMAIMGLHNPARTDISGEILLHLDSETVEINSISEERIRKIRGNDVAMIFQDPMSSLHPYYTINNQISEAWLLHNSGDKKKARARTLEMLDLVGIPDPQKRIDEYPHQFSGGMRQRVMIAMALVNNPKLLIADEPTTALDVTVQAEILALISRMQKEFNTAVLLITHDLGVVAEVADRINVMYAGKLVEQGSVDDIFYQPNHPYTHGLLSSIPRVDHSHGGKLPTIQGQPPSLISLPKGCAFFERCEFARHVPGNLCQSQSPTSTIKREGQEARCHLSAEEVTRIAKARGSDYV